MGLRAAPFRILGIDPGSRATGYGVIDKNGHSLTFVACGVIRATPRASLPARLREIYDGVSEVIVTHQPAKAAVENVFVSVNAMSALKLGHARGVILLALIQQGLEVREYSPRLIKQTVAGYGQAAKAQVQHMVRAMLSLSATPSQDAADALAVALCFASHWRPAGGMQP
ncbi:MAG: crossover junction endodeoxyribonuclease RuvC [Deltaproteobacteria bacterium CG_4_10_14_3_um_filter_60_8]|nr:MAG: crossover junction endodeoxyribonuclease RuvC [Desulfobacterales bacterium CG2_30_60_27]PIP43825.1 MAG: crossover junction endodeoxyribonuclease RuvC [Deltaproteobacteria bacterium CG23_combo_of_CG06-09_8_20_14_all_60_8]PIY21127.1 MAG: crossover junction endodeoxyribonuclease RuvC [Deltaproteobacteria bacterium CG_4_10_14_3_um_filter_60_8]